MHREGSAPWYQRQQADESRGPHVGNIEERREKGAEVRHNERTQLTAERKIIQIRALMRKIAMVEKKKTISKEKAAENLKAFRRDLRDRAWKRVAGSKIPDLVKVGLLMSNALSLLTAQIDVMIRAALKVEGVNATTTGGDGDMICGMKNYAEKTKAAEYWFERDLKPYIEDCTFGSYGVKAYDDFNHSSAEVIQLLMLCVDRGGVDGGMEKVFRSLQRLKKGTRFSDEDIARFDFKE